MMSETSFLKLLQDARALFQREPNLLDVNTLPLVFVGDLHGDIETTKKIFEVYWPQDHTLVFLGDYVDRAILPNGSLDTLQLLLEKKLEQPGRVLLLRGNHEFESVYLYNGFGAEIYEAYEPPQQVLDAVRETFAQLPYVVTTAQGIVALHGGLPDLQALGDLMVLPKGIHDAQDHALISQIVWSDHEESLLEGTLPNYDRGFSDRSALCYSEAHFDHILTLLGRTVLLRGHKPSQKGYAFHDRLLTIFTSQVYAEKGAQKGTYVAVLSSEKNVSTCKDLELRFV